MARHEQLGLSKKEREEVRGKLDEAWKGSIPLVAAPFSVVALFGQVAISILAEGSSWEEIKATRGSPEDSVEGLIPSRYVRS